MASYSDDFNRSDSTNIGNWVEWNDDWSITSNQLAPGTASIAFVIYASPLATSDHYTQAVLANATTSSMGVFARSTSDGSSYYLWRSNGSVWNLFRQVGGSFIDLGSYNASLANGDVARIECVGSTIKGYVNGIERLSVTDTVITSGLYAGIRSTPSSTARYDNFLTSDISPIVDSDIGAFFDFM